MAFTGVAVVTKISDKKFRITGLSLAGDASGTIGFSDKDAAAEVSLDAPEWQPYRNAESDLVSLIAAVEVRVGLLTDVTTPVPISCVKTGTDHGNFVATLHNDTVATVSPILEIYVEFH
jgi:hypothetical protein